MQPIGDYLKKLLYQYDCIVVPTLGAFLTHSVSASFNEATGQFLPPRRKVAFNEALMLDDGILLNYVMLHEGISRDEALRAINGFVTTLKQQARQMGSFVIEGLGLFSYNSENSLQFDPELRLNFLGTAFGMQPVLLANKVVHLATPTTLVKSASTPASQPQLPAVVSVGVTAVALTSEVEEGQVMPMAVHRFGGIWRWAAAALLVGSLGFISYFSVIRPGDPLQSSLNPALLFRMPSSSLKVPAELAKTPVPTMTTTAPVVVVPVASNEAPVAKLTEKPTAELNPVSSVKARVALSKVKDNQSTITPALPNAPVVTETGAALRKTHFTVIAGSFASRSNAVRFQKRLVKAGYSDAYIVQGQGLIKVAAIGAESLSEAEAGIDSLSSLTGITPWIMRNH